MREKEGGRMKGGWKKKGGTTGGVGMGREGKKDEQWDEWID